MIESMAETSTHFKEGLSYEKIHLALALKLYLLKLNKYQKTKGIKY